MGNLRNIWSVREIVNLIKCPTVNLRWSLWVFNHCQCYELHSRLDPSQWTCSLISQSTYVYGYFELYRTNDYCAFILYWSVASYNEAANGIVPRGSCSKHYISRRYVFPRWASLQSKSRSVLGILNVWIWMVLVHRWNLCWRWAYIPCLAVLYRSQICPLMYEMQETAQVPFQKHVVIYLLSIAPQCVRRGQSMIVMRYSLTSAYKILVQRHCFGWCSCAGDGNCSDCTRGESTGHPRIHKCSCLPSWRQG